MLGIFFPKADAEPTADNFAIAYAQRRSWVMWSWLHGAIMAVVGAVYALVSLLLGEDPETGTFMALLGLAIAALGWLVSAPKRFSRKLPKPAMDVPRVEQAIRINRGVVIFSNVLMAALILAAAFGTPKGLSAESLPMLAAMLVFAPLLSVGMVRTKKLLVERGPRYDRWLQNR